MIFRSVAVRSVVVRSVALRILALLPISVLLAGCGITPGAKPTAASARPLHGNVHGGQQPIAGAHVYLFAADTSAFGNPSVSLLNAAATGNSDSVGAYVLTDASGSWDITGDYSCTPNTQMYLYVLGGDPGAGVNSASGLMAAVGSCSSSGTFDPSKPYVWINEVSTVAAAYAMAPYAIDALHVGSSGTPLALTGIANAFANASNLADLASGTALATTPNGNGAVPQAQINMLANVLAACVNSTGPGSPNCSTLLGEATSDGTPFGAMPSDTASAMINIVHHPGANVADLFNLPPAAAAFAPALSAQPNDFTVAVTYTGTSISAPSSVSIDSAGNAWIANGGNASVTMLSSAGVPLPNSPVSGDGLDSPSQIAIDASGNAWVANSGSNTISEFDATGSAITAFYTGSNNAPESIAADPSGNIWTVSGGANSVTLLTTVGVAAPHNITGGGLDSPDFVAVDHSGNIWVTNQFNDSVTIFDHTGTPLVNSPIAGNGISMPVAITIDAVGNAWVSNFGSNSISVIDINGSPFPGSPFSAGGLSNPLVVAFDGGGNAWVANDGGTGVTELTSSGSAVTGSPFGEAPSSRFVAVDGSGSVWVADQADDAVIQIIGAAVPAVTPLAMAVKNNTIGARP